MNLLRTEAGLYHSWVSEELPELIALKQTQLPSLLEWATAGSASMGQACSEGLICHFCTSGVFFSSVGSLWSRTCDILVNGDD